MDDIRITITYRLLKKRFQHPNNDYTVKTSLCLTCLYPFTETFNYEGYERKRKTDEFLEFLSKPSQKRGGKEEEEEEENTHQFRKEKRNQLDSYKGGTGQFKIIGQIST